MKTSRPGERARRLRCERAGLLGARLRVELVEVFHKFDADHSDTIDADELGQIFEEAGKSVTPRSSELILDVLHAHDGAAARRPRKRPTPRRQRGSGGSGAAPAVKAEVSFREFLAG